MRLFLFIFLVSFILAFGIFTIDALSFIMTLAKAHKVYVQSNSSNPAMMLLLVICWLLRQDLNLQIFSLTGSCCTYLATQEY